MELGHVDYGKNGAPADYKCDNCGAIGVKLWREYQTIVSHQSLFCLRCACEEQGEKRMPTEDGKSLYTGKIQHWARTAHMQPNRWIGYDPAKGPPEDVVETRTEKITSDKIGRRVPAVPTEEGDTFWGYTSVPEAGCTWWYNLPVVPKTQPSTSP